MHVEQTDNEIFVEDMKFANDTSASADSDNSSKRGKTKSGNTQHALQCIRKCYHQTDVALDKGVPVTTALRVLRLWMEEQ
jgi:hypothetical protein